MRRLLQFKSVRIVLSVLVIIAAIFLTAVSINEAAELSDDFPTWRSIYSFLNGRVPANRKVDAGNAEVHFIDVGQGDCALIRTPEQNILIDCGEYESYRAVNRYLKDLGIKRLDMIIMSHPHSDHMGCMYKIADKYEVGSIMMPELPYEMQPESGSYSRLMESIRRKNIPVIYAVPGSVCDTGSGGNIRVIAPVGEYDDLNNSSAVVMFTFGDTRFIFCGDAEKDAEEDILASGADIDADVIKVPHHGSDSSSTRGFVNAVSPDYAVFCVGAENDYGHPHADIVERYIYYGAKILRTDMNGNIKFVTDGQEITVSTQKESDIFGALPDAA